MCFLMAGFFRKSLGLGGKQSIPLAEELSLAETFLAIEEVRFGERLRTRFDDRRMMCSRSSVPPLVLQPLVENAVHHGVAHLLEGGEVMVRDATARRRCWSSRWRTPAIRIARHRAVPVSDLSNVRSRIDTLFGHRASVDVKAGTH